MHRSIFSNKIEFFMACRRRGTAWHSDGVAKNYLSSVPICFVAYCLLFPLLCCRTNYVMLFLQWLLLDGSINRLFYAVLIELYE